MPFQELNNPAVEGIFQGLRDYSSKYSAFQGTLQDVIRSMSYTYNNLLNQYNKLTDWYIRGTDERGQPLDQQRVRESMQSLSDILTKLAAPFLPATMALPKQYTMPGLPGSFNPPSQQRNQTTTSQQGQLPSTIMPLPGGPRTNPSSSASSPSTNTTNVPSDNTSTGTTPPLNLRSRKKK